MKNNLLPEGWEEVRLGDIMHFKNGVNFGKNEIGKQIKIVGVADFKDYTELNNIDKLSEVKVSQRLSNDYYLNKNDFLFVRSNGNKKLVGRFLKINVEEEVIFSGFTICGRLINKCVIPKYLGTLFEKGLIKKVLAREVGGTNISNLNQKILSNINFYSPPLEEQERIVKVLEVWDKAISTTTALLESYEKEKKAYMQRLFPQKDQKAPQWRFKGFTAPWQQKRLGGIANLKKGQQLNRLKLTDNEKYPSISGGIEPSGYTNKYNREENTITISEGGNSCGHINLIKSKFWCGGHCYSVHGHHDLITNLFYYILKNSESEIMRLRVGSGLPNIQKNDLLNFKIHLPLEKEEQKSIAEFLSSVDEKIEKTKRLLELYKQQKKGLLEKLLTAQWRVCK